jgi:hypothetical protein
MKILNYRPRSSGYLVYSGICLINGENLNILLRKAENPQHIKWEFERITSDNERKNAKKLYYEIIDDLNKQINLLISKDSTDQSDIEGASEYLPEVDPVGTTHKQKEKSTKQKTIIDVQTSVITSKTASEKNENKETEELVQAGLIDGEDVSVNTENSSGNGSGGTAGETPKGINDLGNKKVLIPQKTGQYQLRLFSPSGSHNHQILVINHHLPFSSIDIQIHKIDEEGHLINTKILKTMNHNKALDVSNNTIKNVPNLNQTITLEVTFDELIPVSAEVSIYADNK